MVSDIVAWRGSCRGEQVHVPWVVEEFVGELLEEVLVAGLQGGEVQGVESLLVGGVAGPQDQPHRPLLHPLKLKALSGVEGR